MSSFIIPALSLSLVQLDVIDCPSDCSLLCCDTLSVSSSSEAFLCKLIGRVNNAGGIQPRDLCGPTLVITSHCRRRSLLENMTVAQNSGNQLSFYLSLSFILFFIYACVFYLTHTHAPSTCSCTTSDNIALATDFSQQVIYNCNFLNCTTEKMHYMYANTLSHSHTHT